MYLNVSWNIFVSITFSNGNDFLKNILRFSMWIFPRERKHENLMWNIVLMNFAGQESSRAQQAREFGKFQLFLLALKIRRERIPAFQPFFYQDVRKARSKPGKFPRSPRAVSSGSLKTAETFPKHKFSSARNVPAGFFYSFSQCQCENSNGIGVAFLSDTRLCAESWKFHETFQRQWERITMGGIRL